MFLKQLKIINIVELVFKIIIIAKVFETVKIVKIRT